MISFPPGDPAGFVGHSMYVSQDDTTDPDSFGATERRRIFLGFFHRKMG